VTALYFLVQIITYFPEMESLMPDLETDAHENNK